VSVRLQSMSRAKPTARRKRFPGPLFLSIGCRNVRVACLKTQTHLFLFVRNNCDTLVCSRQESIRGGGRSGGAASHCVDAAAPDPSALVTLRIDASISGHHLAPGFKFAKANACAWLREDRKVVVLVRFDEALPQIC